jgi:hypothetical protein
MLLLAQPVHAAEACDAAFDKADGSSARVSAALEAVTAGLPEIPRNASLPEAEVHELLVRYCTAWRLAPLAALLQAPDEMLADSRSTVNVCTGEDRTFAESDLVDAEDLENTVVTMVENNTRRCMPY